jgi:DNA topoisomerase-1
MPSKVLIVTEKDMAAQKIASILGDRVEVTRHGSGKQKVNSYAFSYNGRPAVAIGLRGHVMHTTFPERYRRWSLKNLLEIIRDPDLDWVVDGGAVSVLAALRAVAKGADELIVATDFDREGELIGHEALQILRGAALRRHHDGEAAKPGKGAGRRGAPAPPITDAADAVDDGRVRPMLPAGVVDRHHRVRYSALIADDVRAAFAKPVTLDFNLADAARARQDIDLLWGAVLSRFFSLASYRYGASFLSVGRVQTPTLRLIVERERERLAFIPVPYWEVWAELEKDGERFAAAHRRGRFDARAQAEAALAGARPGPAVVTAYEAKPRTVKPPAPFNTTALMSASSGTGVSPARAMRAAEALYLAGLISYPRTDNTVYPKSLDLRAVCGTLSAWSPVAAVAGRLQQAPRLSPTRGAKHTSDHPPIYPVGVPTQPLAGDQAKVYELVARRFLATLMPAATIEGQRADLRIGDQPFVARGSRVAQPGFLEVYDKYTASRERPLPQLAPGDTVQVIDLHLDDKETQPPGRYGQGTLIEKMEELNLGTKATRADIIQRLYDRTYVRGNPVEPTELGIALIDAFDAALADAPVDISSPEMTARLEADMDRLAAGDVPVPAATGVLADEDDGRPWHVVVKESQQMLEEAWKRLDASIEQVRAVVLQALRREQTLGQCPNCGGELAIVVSKKTGKRFAACRGKPGEAQPAESASGNGNQAASAPDTAAEASGPVRRGCGQTYPLPPFGQIVGAGKACPTCGLPMIRVVGARGSREQCIDYYGCPSNKALHERRARRRAAGSA